MNYDELRTVQPRQIIQVRKRADWVDVTVLAVDSADRVWFEIPEPTNPRGFDVMTEPLENLRLIPTRQDGCFGVSVRYHGNGNEPRVQIYGFTNEADAISFRDRHFNMGQDEQFLEIIRLPSIIVPVRR